MIKYVTKKNIKDFLIFTIAPTSDFLMGKLEAWLENYKDEH